MKIRIVCQDDSWILEKFARKMRENLEKMHISVYVDKVPDKEADINHYIIYSDYDSNNFNDIDTLMVTHIDRDKKLKILKNNLEKAYMGICMSEETVINMANMGIDREKLCFINPAHDEVMIPRKKIIGITCRVQSDGRKREAFISKLAKIISPKLFSFKIMGDGWDSQVKDLIDNGFEVEYTNEFVYDKYLELIPSLDYYLYTGQDEGQMGFVDAVAAGVETIVTSQGYHLDVDCGISYPFSTFEELVEIFKTIENKRQAMIDSVSSWTWYEYTKKHVELWEYCIAKKRGEKYTYKAPTYKDGINSVQEFSENKNVKLSRKEKRKVAFSLFKGTLRHKYFVNIKKK